MGKLQFARLNVPEQKVRIVRMPEQNFFQIFCWNGQTRSCYLYESLVWSLLGFQEKVRGAHALISKMTHLDRLSIGSFGNDGCQTILKKDDALGRNIRFDKHITGRKIDWFELAR